MKDFVQKLLAQNAASFVAMILLVAVPVLVSSGLAVYLYQYQTLLQDLSTTELLLYFIIVSVTMALALTPTTFVALVSGFYLGWVGFPGVVVSYGLAALIGYSLARLIDHGKMMGFLNHFPKAMFLMQELRQQSWTLIFLTRISPVLPFALMNFVLAVIRVDKWRFWIAIMIGMLPRTLFFYWVGTQANDIIQLLQNPDSGTSGKVLMIVLVLISIGGLYFVIDRAIKRALADAAASEKK
ncbi:MAG: VTT domain-containing protein [Hymenobacteraceae bacterium]|nr:VTT domain-containing protein [Hymenobacteraceae bacterium]MDX5397015.1 VTT domain-containing protein [Hymenobacteraceae bacterium]MDX5442346.1 VTT domain-containing protein [Hymenobacteraceae bacterium]MDX5513089.1 VTT domain-containing protein [Hymenobacteraceae bacterium]